MRVRQLPHSIFGANCGSFVVCRAHSLCAARIRESRFRLVARQAYPVFGCAARAWCTGCAAAADCSMEDDNSAFIDPEAGSGIRNAPNGPPRSPVSLVSNLLSDLGQVRLRSGKRCNLCTAVATLKPGMCAFQRPPSSLAGHTHPRCFPSGFRCATHRLVCPAGPKVGTGARGLGGHVRVCLVEEAGRRREATTAR